MATIVAELQIAVQAFNRTHGKRTEDEAYELLMSLGLSKEAENVVEEIIVHVYRHDAVAGYVRFDGIVSRLQVAAIRIEQAVA